MCLITITERESIINDSDSVDRISDLPDSILGLILSFLPIKKAVATSILSKRWKFAWVSIHNLDFCYNSRIEQMKFIRYVNHVLLLHDAGLLNKFSLYWCVDCSSSSHVTSWVNNAITKNVSELSLHLLPDHGLFEMPPSVFNCNSLRSLHLAGNIYVSVAIPIFLPRLQTLRLDRVHFPSEEALENIISGCPILNYLDLQVPYDHCFTCRISSTSLRHVEIFFGERCALYLNTCSLEYLKVKGQISEIFVQNNLSSLVEVDFSIIHEVGYNNSIVEAVRAFDRAKSLTFSKDVMLALSYATIGLSTEFKRLVELKTEICGSMQASMEYRGNLGALTTNQDESNESEKWNPLEEAARCLSYSLKTVSFHCVGFYADHETIRYILKHGGALEVVNIYFGEMIAKVSKWSKLVKEISEFSRKSPICEVKFFFEKT